MSWRGVLWNMRRAALGCVLVGLGGLLAGGPGPATATEPWAATGQVAAGGNAVTCSRGPSESDNVEKVHFGQEFPQSSVRQEVNVTDQDNWCDGSSNQEFGHATADPGATLINVASTIQSAHDKETTFGFPVYPLVVSLANLDVSMSFVPGPGGPPRPGFAYVVLVGFADYGSGSLVPCGSIGDVIPCRETKFRVGSPVVPAVNPNTVAVDEDILPATRRGVTYYIASKLPPPGQFNLLDIPMLLTANVVGNGEASGGVDIFSVETPDGWKPSAPSFQQPVGPNALPTLPPPFVVVAGQAVPAPQGSVLLSPPSGTLVPGQAFDLALVIQTAGQTVVGFTASLDGADVSAPLGACLALHPETLTRGTPGVVFRCPGLSTGVFGPGTHTLSASMALSGGATLTDSAIWTVLGGTVAAAAGSGPSVEVSPPPGVYTETEAFDLGLVVDLKGRALVSAQLTFDEVDVTGLVVGCSSMGALPTGQLTLRCPGLSGAALGPGTHFFHVVLNLDDGSEVLGGAVWQVLSAAGS